MDTVVHRGATTFSQLGVQFLGLGYCTEQNTDGIPSFVHCSLLRNGNHTLYHKSWGGQSKYWGSGPPEPAVVAPLVVQQRDGPRRLHVYDDDDDDDDLKADGERPLSLRSSGSEC